MYQYAVKPFQLYERRANFRAIPYYLTYFLVNCMAFVYPQYLEQLVDSRDNSKFLRYKIED